MSRQVIEHSGNEDINVALDKINRNFAELYTSLGATGATGATGPTGPTGATGAGGATTQVAIVNGAAAGNITITGITTAKTLIAVLRLVGAATTITNITDLTSEFTIVSNDTIDNNGGTSSAGSKLLVIWA